MKIVQLSLAFLAVFVSARADVPSASDQYKLETLRVVKPADRSSAKPNELVQDESGKKYQPIVPGMTFPSIKLKSGRVLVNAKFLGATTEHASFAVDRTIESILVVQLPFEIAMASVDYAEKTQLSLLDRAAAAKIIEQQQRERMQKFYDEKAKDYAARKAQEDEDEARKVELASSTRDDLRITSTSIDMASAFVTVENTGSSEQRFDWHKMKAKYRDGRIEQATSCVTNDRSFGYTVPSHGTRRFNLGFGYRRIGDGSWVVDLSWVEGVWIKENRGR